MISSANPVASTSRRWRSSRSGRALRAIEDSLSVRWIGHKRRRITGPPRCQFAPHAASGNTFRSLYDFKHRVPLAGAKIHGRRLAAALQVFRRSNMGIGQIASVDVVANANANNLDRRSVQHSQPSDMVQAAWLRPGPATLKMLDGQIDRPRRGIS